MTNNKTLFREIYILCFIPLTCHTSKWEHEQKCMYSSMPSYIELSYEHTRKGTPQLCATDVTYTLKITQTAQTHNTSCYCFWQNLSSSLQGPFTDNTKLLTHTHTPTHPHSQINLRWNADLSPLQHSRLGSKISSDRE